MLWLRGDLAFSFFEWMKKLIHCHALNDLLCYQSVQPFHDLERTIAQYHPFLPQKHNYNRLFHEENIQVPPEYLFLLHSNFSLTIVYRELD